MSDSPSKTPPPDLSVIGRGVERVEAKVAPDVRDDLEKDASKRRYDAETRAIVESNRDRRMHRKMRLSYANKVFCYLAWYSVFVGILLVVLGVSGGTWFKLPDLVVTTLVGSTAAAAIGLVGFVVSGLFKDLR